MKILIYILVGIAFSCYFFPFGFTFLPNNLNSKNLTAFGGLFIYVIHLINTRKLLIDKYFIGAIIIVFTYSIIGYISTDINNTTDYSYANYFISFSVWTLGAYFVCTLINKVHGYINLRIIATYLAFIAVTQCILALLIRFIPPFKFFVDIFIDQGQNFLDDIDRWYGIGAALDPAGVRFAMILILIGAVLVESKLVNDSKKYSSLLLVAFLTIVAIGNIISRTTIVGASMGLAYLFLGNFKLTSKLSFHKISKILIYLSILIIIIISSIYLYQTNESFHESLRYGFEGFFNWAEKGEWTTASTEKLDNEMWIWPDDSQSWLIGKGLFDGWVFGTDIGYCRLILYNGLIGFGVFCFLFIYNTIIFSNIYKNYLFMFCLYLIMSFIVWIKVSTDLYQIWAIFFNMYFLSQQRESEELA